MVVLSRTRLGCVNLVLDDARVPDAGRGVVRPLLRRPQPAAIKRIERGQDADGVPDSHHIFGVQARIGLRAGDDHGWAFERIGRVSLSVRPEQHGEIRARGRRHGHYANVPCRIHSNGSKLRVEARTGNLRGLADYARSCLRTIQVGPKHHIVGVSPLRSAPGSAGPRGQYDLKVRAELNKIIQPMTFSDSQRNRAVACLRNGTRRAAARLAVEPLVLSRADAGLDLLLAVRVVGSGGSIPGKGIHNPMKGEVLCVLAAAGSRPIAGLGSKKCWRVRVLGSIMVNRGVYVERHVVDAIDVLGRYPLRNRSYLG